MKDKRFSLRQLILTGALCALGALVVAAGVLTLCFNGWDVFAHSWKFAEVLSIIDRKYIGEYDLDELSDAAYSGLVATTGDRWSYYMTAEAYASYKDYVANQYEGIGVTISKDPDSGYMRVEAVAADSPAEAAGVVAGDLLTSVAGEDLSGLDISGMKALIAGQKGSFELGLLRSDGSSLTVTLRRTKIYSDPVTYELMSGNIGYIKLKNFEEGSGSGAIEAVESLIDEGAQSLVFDVRSNPGGLVSELVELLDYLLPEGDLFVSVDRQGGEKVDRSGKSCVELPMAVLVNGDSYSAAEFFAAALSEYDWATVVGSRTSGKGRSQITLTLTDGSAVHISSKKYLTPDRVDLSEVGGLTPEIELEQTDGADAQLEAALEALGGGRNSAQTIS